MRVSKSINTVLANNRKYFDGIDNNSIVSILFDEKWT